MLNTCIENALRLLVVAVLFNPALFQEDWHFTGADVALGQYTTQSSTFLNYFSNLAVDGVLDQDIEHNHCSHTNNSNAWWKVILAKASTIKGVRIYNRINNFGRLKDFRVVGDPDDVELYNDATASQPVCNNSVIEIPVDIMTQFTYLAVRIPGQFLTLCEVQVYTVTYCPPPPDVLNGRYRGAVGKYIPGDYLWIKCRGRFFADADNEQECLPNSTWSQPTPICKQIRCSHPERLNNGHYTLSNGTRYVFGAVDIGTTISVICETIGFIPTISTMTCTTRGTWAKQATCRDSTFINCSIDSLHAAQNNYILDDRYNVTIPYNATVTASCKPLFEWNSGNYTRACQADGTFSGRELLCASPIECSLQLLQPKKGFYYLDDNYGSAVEYNTTISTSCRPSFELTRGDFTRVCLAGGNLSGTELQCMFVPHRDQGCSNAWGISVTVVLALLIVIICAAWCIYKRKKATPLIQTSEGEVASYGANYAVNNRLEGDGISVSNAYSSLSREDFGKTV